MTTEESGPGEEWKRGWRRVVLALAEWEANLLPGPLGNRLRKDLDTLKNQAPLVARAREVSEALSKATTLLNELQAEVKLRSVIVEKLEDERVQAEQRTADATLRAALSEDEAKAVDSLVDRVLQTRLMELERNARRREWAIGTVVALIVGVASILVSHYALGF